MGTIEARDYQIRIIANVMKAVDEGHCHILIEAPTGSGKTIIAHLIAKQLYEKYGLDAGWCAMRKHLLRQAEAENRDKIGFEHIQYFSMFDKNPPQVGVLIDDEGHHTAADSAVTIYRKAKPKIHIGLTATPFRTDRMKLCFSKVIKDAGIRALIDQGYLASFRQYTFDMPWTPENVAEVYINNVDRWGKTVGYFLTRDECERCAAIIRASGTPCEVVWAQSDQERQINAFMSGEVPILLNMVILTEGFDAPDLQTVFVRPGSRGPTIQMVGRALRPKPYAQVVQNHDTKWLFTRTASAEKRFVFNRGQWEDRDFISDKVLAASMNTMRAIPHIRVEMPKAIGKYKRKTRVFGRDV